MTLDADRLREVEETDELHDTMETASNEVATELLDRAGEVLELTERQRDGVRVLLCAAWSRGCAWEYNWTGEHLEKILAPVLGDVKLGRVDPRSSL